nr:hypothetical protein [Moorella thermoacetica]
MGRRRECEILTGQVPHDEHAAAELRHAVPGGVEYGVPYRVAHFFKPPHHPGEIAAAAPGQKTRHVLDNHPGRPLRPDQAQEIGEEVALVFRAAALSGQAPALARYACGPGVGFRDVLRVELFQIRDHGVGADIFVVSLDGHRVAVGGPDGLHSGHLKTQRQPARPAAEIDEFQRHAGFTPKKKLRPGFPRPERERINL